MKLPRDRHAYRQTAALTFAVALLVLIFWGVLIIGYYQNMLSLERSNVQRQADEISAYLTSRTQLRQSQLIGIAEAMKPRHNMQLRGGDFYNLVSVIVDSDEIVRLAQYFPVEGKALVYPLVGNEAVANRTFTMLINDERPWVREESLRAVETRAMTVSDPYELIQGGRGVVARYAVYDGDTLKGIAVLILDLESLLNVPGLMPPAEGLQFAISDKSGKVFYGAAFQEGDAPVISRVKLADGSWALSAAPAQGWGKAFQAQVALFAFLGVLVAALCGAVAWQIAATRVKLQHTVAERTIELKRSEERYASALRIVNEGIWEANLKTGEIYTSPNCAALLGFEEGHMFRSISEVFALIGPEDVENLTSEIRGGLPSDAGFGLTLDMRKADGATIAAQIRGQVVERDAAGMPLRLLGTLADVTEQVQAESLLREGEARFRALFSNNHAPMLLVDPEDGRIIDANPAASSFYGWSIANLTAMRLTQINTLSPEEQARRRKDALEQKRRTFIFQHRLASGEVRDVEVFSGPIEHNGKTLLYSIVHDVTARRQAERALAESEARYRELLEKAPVGIWVHSGDTIRFANRAVARMLGAGAPEELLNRSVYDMLPPNLRAQTQERIRQLEAGNGGRYPIRNTFLKMDGMPLEGEVQAIALNYQGVPSVLAIITDITERKKAEEKIAETQKELRRLLAEADESRKVLLSVVEDQKIAEEKLSQLNTELEMRVQERTAQLEAANKELEAFSYSVSHDLRAPLRGIDGWSVALLEDYGSQFDAQARQYLDRVRSETRRMGDLIDDLLRLSRITRVEMTRSEVDLSQMAQTIAARLVERDPARQNDGRKVTFNVEPGVTVAGDPNLLEIALTNLLSNAYKFTGRQQDARITFGVTTIDGKRTCFVSDNGAGFDMTFAKNLFGAFQRMHKPAEFPGTGIGLATVQRIIHRHGGRVWADAKKNQGATFYFTIMESEAS